MCDEYDDFSSDSIIDFDDDFSDEPIIDFDDSFSDGPIVDFDDDFSDASIVDFDNGYDNSIEELLNNTEEGSVENLAEITSLEIPDSDGDEVITEDFNLEELQNNTDEGSAEQLEEIINSDGNLDDTLYMTREDIENIIEETNDPEELRQLENEIVSGRVQVDTGYNLIEDGDFTEDDAAFVRTRDHNEQWEVGNRYIDDNVEAIRDDLRDKGMEDGPEMESIAMTERARMQEELANNINRDFSNGYYYDPIKNYLDNCSDDPINYLSDSNSCEEITNLMNNDIDDQMAAINTSHKKPTANEIAEGLSAAVAGMAVVSMPMNYVDAYQEVKTVDIPEDISTEQIQIEQIQTINDILDEYGVVQIDAEEIGEIKAEEQEERIRQINEAEEGKGIEVFDKPPENPEEFSINSVYEGLDYYDFDGKNYLLDSERLDSSLDYFNDENWEALSLDEKEMAMLDLGEYVKEVIGFENPPEIVFYNSEVEGEYGGYFPDTNTLEINEYMLYENDEAADTVAHELWHAYQHERAMNPQSAKDYQYQYGFDNYISPDEDFIGYQNQLVESEARIFAEQFKNRINMIGGKI